MDGFTGLSPQEAKNNLNEFTAGMFDVQDTLYDELNDMMMQLASNWYSTKAVAFGNTYIPLLNDVLNEIMACAYRIRKDAVAAYNRLANANGLPTLNDDCQQANGIFFTNVMFKDTNDSGVVGMSVEKIKTDVIANGHRNAKQALNKFDEVPMNIAFYDNDGAIAAAYSSAIKACEMKIINTVNETVRAIINALEEETAAIQKAREEATDALNTTVA